MLVLQVLPQRAEDPLIHCARIVQLAANRAPPAAPQLRLCARRDGQAGPASVPACSEEELRERPKAGVIIKTCTLASWELGAWGTLHLGWILNAGKT